MSRSRRDKGRSARIVRQGSFGLALAVIFGCVLGNSSLSSASNLAKASQRARQHAFSSSLTEGRFVNGDRQFFIYRDTNHGDRLYAGALYIGATCAVVKDGAPVLQPDYAKPLPYIDQTRFSLNGSWSWIVEGRSPGTRERRSHEGTATGTVSADGNTVTVSWPRFPCGAAGNSVVFTREALRRRLSAGLTEGRFVNGDRQFFIYRDTHHGDRLYAGALYVRDLCQVETGAAVLQPDYAKPLPYIDQNKFSLTGSWAFKYGRDPGTATGTVSADGNTVTVTWPRFPCGAAGNDVVFKRP
jgi:hypothetical protein